MKGGDSADVVLRIDDDDDSEENSSSNPNPDLPFQRSSLQFLKKSIKINRFNTQLEYIEIMSKDVEKERKKERKGWLEQ